MQTESASPRPARIDPVDAWRHSLDVVLRRYGYYGYAAQPAADAGELDVARTGWDDGEPSSKRAGVLFVAPADDLHIAGLDCRIEPAGGMSYPTRRRWFRRPKPIYHALLPHVSFSGSSVEPIWITETGRTVLGWWHPREERACLLVGLQAVEELVRYTQGDPEQVERAVDKTMWGHGHERPAYLFDGNLVPRSELEPWADRLGFELAGCFARASGLPLLGTLPNGARGGVLLTGDDDEAWLEKYEEQLELIGEFPITYLLLPHTRHSGETLSKLPPNVELGVHVDALEAPERYEKTCEQQTAAVREMTGAAVRAVRNHGHLNDGYWSHLPAWERSGLQLDLNLRGIDGTCVTGSYLPFRVRRRDGTWSEHFSLFSTFSDSMYYLQKWSQRTQIRCITKLADQIQRRFPGVLVFNFHPQNVSDSAEVHRAVMAIGKRPGWVALGAESYIDWLQALERIRLIRDQGRLLLRCSERVSGLELQWPSAGAPKQKLSSWRDEVELKPPGRG